MNEDQNIPPGLRSQYLHGQNKKTNAGEGFALPISAEDQQFLRENKNSEMFRTVLRLCDVYKKHGLGQLMKAREHDQIIRYQGQMQGVQAMENLLKFASETPPPGEAA